MNILLIHHLTDNNGQAQYGAVPYYRMQKPHEVLNRLYPEYDYITSNSLNIEESILKQTDLILFTRSVTESDLLKLNELGIKWGIDIDDYWHLPDDHLLYQNYLDNNTSKQTENGLTQAHFVICTTEILADKIKPFNKNVYVIENGIDTEDKSWQPNKIKSNKVRFGFTGGTTHVPDVMLINKSVSESLKDVDFKKKGQIVLCGFNAEFNKASVYVGYERLLTDDLNSISDQDYVRRLKKLGNVNGNSYEYKRIPNLPVNQFGTIHNELDIVVAPLKETEFHSCKSNIKMLEAGFMDCAIMCHEVSPYKELMTKDNSFSLTDKTFFEWQRYIIENPSALIDKKRQLKEDTKRFNLTLISEKRHRLYQALFN